MQQPLTANRLNTNNQECTKPGTLHRFARQTVRLTSGLGKPDRRGQTAARPDNPRIDPHRSDHPTPCRHRHDGETETGSVPGPAARAAYNHPRKRHEIRNSRGVGHYCLTW